MSIKKVHLYFYSFLISWCRRNGEDKKQSDGEVSDLDVTV